MALVPVAEALERLLEGAAALPGESVALADAADRVLAEPVVALRTQPPFNASAMDGYAARAADVASAPARLSVIGMAPAGRGFDGTVGKAQAVRIFTGAPLPEGADTIVIQENVRDLGGGQIEVIEPTAKDATSAASAWIFARRRPAGKRPRARSGRAVAGGVGQSSRGSTW